MSAPPEHFEAATSVTRTGPACYAARVSGALSFAGAPSGGYLMATMLRAATDACAHEHPIVASVEFMRVARAGPAEIAVETVRAGRSLTTARVTLHQDGQPVTEGLVTVGTVDSAEPARWTAPPPAIAELEESTPAASEREGIARQLDLRFDPATDGWRTGRPSGVPELRAWLRLRPPIDPDPYVLAFAADALPPVIVNVGLRGWAPTVRLTWQLRALPAPGWLAVHARGRSTSQRWFDEDVELWDSAGQLVAQSRQLALVGRPRPREEEAS